MVAILKLVCIGIYALGVASLLGLLPGSWGIVVTISAVLLALHALEAIVMFKHVRRYEGALATSILLCLLFGLLHWKPLADRSRPLQ
jgi:hypothetical protein